MNDKVRELPAKWRESADKLDKGFGPGDMLVACGKRVCADELEAALQKAGEPVAFLTPLSIQRLAESRAADPSTTTNTGWADAWANNNITGSLVPVFAAPPVDAAALLRLAKSLPEYERVREEFEIVSRIGRTADVRSAMLNVDDMIRALAPAGGIP